MKNMSYKSRRKISAGLFLKSKKKPKIIFLPPKGNLQCPTGPSDNHCLEFISLTNQPTGLWPDIINNPMTINSSWNPLPASSLQAPECHFHCPSSNSPLEAWGSSSLQRSWEPQVTIKYPVLSLGITERGKGPLLLRSKPQHLWNSESQFIQD